MSPAWRNRWMVIPPSTYTCRMPRAPSRDCDVGRIPRHPLHHSPERGGGERAGAEHEHRLVAIGPRLERQDGLERLAADDQRIHRGHELLVAVRFAAARRQEIEVAIQSSDETVEARADKDRCLQRKVLLPVIHCSAAIQSCWRFAIAASRCVERSKALATSGFCISAETRAIERSSAWPSRRWNAIDTSQPESPSNTRRPISGVAYRGAPRYPGQSGPAAIRNTSGTREP